MSNQPKPPKANPTLRKPVKFAVAGAFSVLFGAEMDANDNPVRHVVQLDASGVCQVMTSNKEGLIEIHKGLMHAATVVAQKIAETSKEQADPPPLVQGANIADLPNLHVIPGG